MGEEKRIFGRKDYDNGTSYVGELLDGKPDGKGVYTFETGKYTGSFRNGKYNGYGEYSVNPIEGKTEYLFDNGDYVQGEVYKGNYIDNKQDGRFVVYEYAMPFDREYKMDKEVRSNLYYDIPLPEEEVAPGTIRCTYGGQSSFVVETENATFVFDWYRASIPKFRKGKPIYVFISHRHTDHYHIRLFDISKEYDNVHYYMGLDINGEEKEYYEMLCNYLPEEVDDVTEYFVGDEVYDADCGEITALKSTDLGVAFLIKTGDITLFHAGDLSWFSPVGSMKNYRALLQKVDPKVAEMPDEEFKKKYENIPGPNGINVVKELGKKFMNYMNPISGVEIDYAMIPMDPRFGYLGIYTAELYLERAKIKHFTPMHLWEQYGFASRFAKEHPQYIHNMISVNPDGESMEQTIELNKPYIIDLKKDSGVRFKRIGRNDPCPCGSGKKYKNCHLLLGGFDG